MKLIYKPLERQAKDEDDARTTLAYENYAAYALKEFCMRYFSFKLQTWNS